MCPCMTTTTLLTGSFTTILGACLGFAGSEYIRRRQQFNHAATQFRQVFIEQLLYLRGEVLPYESHIDTVEFLRHRMVKSFEAVETFKACLTTRKRKAFEKAWAQHCYGNNQPNAFTRTQKQKIIFMHYYSLGDDGKIMAEAANNLGKVLSFAKLR